MYKKTVRAGSACSVQFLLSDYHESADEYNPVFRPLRLLRVAVFLRCGGGPDPGIVRGTGERAAASPEYGCDLLFPGAGCGAGAAESIRRGESGFFIAYADGLLLFRLAAAGGLLRPARSGERPEDPGFSLSGRLRISKEHPA